MLPDFSPVAEAAFSMPVSSFATPEATFLASTTRDT
jgi:hypothetical protein